MSKDGINVNQAPDDFYRPQIPPVAPPSANSSTVNPLPCRCGRQADWLLDGSLFGCNSCFVSGTSMADWNALVGADPALIAENEALRGLYQMHKQTETREMRDLKLENERLRKECARLTEENLALLENPGEAL